MHAVDAILVVQVRTGREPGHAHVADRLPLAHASRAFAAWREARHVGVQRRDVAAVLQDDDLAVAVLHARRMTLPSPAA